VALNPLSLIADAHRSALKEAVVGAIQQKRSRDLECQCLHRDGRIIEAVVGLRPISTDAHGPRGCVVAIADVTKLTRRIRAMEREAMETRERLRRLGEEHDLLKGNIAVLVRQKNQ
jgi:hypothetical protein